MKSTKPGQGPARRTPLARIPLAFEEGRMGVDQILAVRPARASR